MCARNLSKFFFPSHFMAVWWIGCLSLQLFLSSKTKDFFCTCSLRDSQWTFQCSVEKTKTWWLHCLLYFFSQDCMLQRSSLHGVAIQITASLFLMWFLHFCPCGTVLHCRTCLLGLTFASHWDRLSVLTAILFCGIFIRKYILISPYSKLHTILYSTLPDSLLIPVTKLFYVRVAPMLTFDIRCNIRRLSSQTNLHQLPPPFSSIFLPFFCFWRV